MKGRKYKTKKQKCREIHLIPLDEDKNVEKSISYH